MTRGGAHLFGVMFVLSACTGERAPSASEPDAAISGRGGGGGAAAVSGRGGGAAATVSGAGGRRSPLECAPHSDEPLQCGGTTCPAQTHFEHDSCFLPCCVMFKGAERCGFRGTSPAFSTACVLPAIADPSCDEVVQFQGCCEPTQKVCGIIGGFAPGCQTKSNFVTLPATPKACGADDADGGTTDRDAG
jgi:hypothetical protein